MDEHIGNSNEPSWFKFHRHWIEDSPVFANAEYFKIFVWLLSRARHKPGSVALKSGQVVNLKAGECIVGRKSGGRALDMSESTFRNRLEKLAELGAITLKKDRSFTRVSIVFSLGCKPKKDRVRTTRGQPEDNPRTTRGQLEDTNKTNETNQTNEKNKFSESVSDHRPPTENEIQNYLQPKYPNLPENEIQRLSGEVIAAISLGKFKAEHWTGHAISWAGATEARLRKDGTIKKSDLRHGQTPPDEAMQQELERLERLSSQYSKSEKKSWVAELPESWKGSNEPS